MLVTRRAWAGPADTRVISEFLYGLYQPDNRDGNWLQPIWEYAYTHPWFDEAALPHIGIWEEDGRVVGVALYELRLGEAFFQVHPGYDHLKPAMLAYAEDHLADTAADGRRSLRVYVNDFDTAFTSLVQARGYTHAPRGDRPMAQVVIADSFPAPRLPPGFRLQSLADDNDLVKMDRVLWRGFNHPGEPPADGPAGRRTMQSGPHYRQDLAIVVVAPSGAFVAYAGLWYEPVNRFGYVEPVATDPEYRRRGLGTAAVLEGIRRCGALGAAVAYVGTDKPFYLAMGFRPLYRQRCWVRLW